MPNWCRHGTYENGVLSLYAPSRIEVVRPVDAYCHAMPQRHEAAYSFSTWGYYSGCRQTRSGSPASAQNGNCQMAPRRLRQAWRGVRSRDGYPVVFRGHIQYEFRARKLNRRHQRPHPRWVPRQRGGRTGGRTATLLRAHLLAAGLVDEARAEATRTRDVLAPISSRHTNRWVEPSCLRPYATSYQCRGRDKSAFRKAMLFEEFIAMEMEAGRFELEFTEINRKRALLHGHCHQKALPSWTVSRRFSDRSQVSKSKPFIKLLRHGGRLRLSGRNL